jgi:hypothetical protein
MSAVPVAAEKTLARKKESGFSVFQLHKRFLTWLNLWLSSLMGDLLTKSARR